MKKLAKIMVCLLMVLGFFAATGVLTADATDIAIQAQVYNQYFAPNHVDYNRAVVMFGPEQAPAGAFLAYRSGRNLDTVYGIYLNSGRNWNRVMISLNIAPASIFVPVPTNTYIGPPYGHAYGYWKKHRHNRSYPIVLTSADVLNLAHLNIICNHYHTPVVNVIRYRTAGKPFTWIVRNEHDKHNKINKFKDNKTKVIKDSGKNHKDTYKDNHKNNLKDNYKDNHKNNVKDTYKDNHKSNIKDNYKDNNNDYKNNDKNNDKGHGEQGKSHGGGKKGK